MKNVTESSKKWPSLPPVPVELKKRTVRLPSSKLQKEATPLDKFFIEEHHASQKDRNDLIEAQNWQNVAVEKIWDKLGEGASVIDEFRKISSNLNIIKNLSLWIGAPVGAVVIGAASIVLADWFEKVISHIHLLP